MHPYFLQTKPWTDFWLDSIGVGHNIHYISHKTDFVEISAYIYEYPWHLGKQFFYIPKGPIFRVLENVSKEHLEIEYGIFLKKVTELAKVNKITCIKLDFDYHFTNFLDIKDNNQLLRFISTHTSYKSLISNKTIQYLSTALLDCSTLQYSDTVDDLMNINTSFWSKTNENIRRYTRKSLKQNWIIETGNTKENFESFWTVYQSTANRQKFAIHPKSYFEKMLKYEFVRLIILKDSEGVPHCVWFGVKIDDTLYYLYGGNDDYSFDHYGQYLIHLVATQIAAQEQVKSYDLGGYDNSKGFGKFKEGYRGEIINFLGPLDIILDPLYYHLIQIGILALKRLKK